MLHHTHFSRNRGWRLLAPAFCVAASSLLLAACSNNHDDAASAPVAPAAQTTLSGVAATGAAIAGASVQLHCVDGSSPSATSAGDGKWTLAIPTSALPCAAKVSGGSVAGVANTSSFYSLAPIASGTATTNLTPLTDLALADAVNSAAGLALDAWFDGSSIATQLPQVASAINAAIADLRSALNSAGYTLPESFDPFVASIVAGAEGDVYDQLLEAYKQALETAASSYADARNGYAGGSTLPPMPSPPAEPPITPPTPPPVGDDSTLAARISRAFAGTFVVSCPVDGGAKVDRTIVINTDGSSSVDGATAVSSSVGGYVQVQGRDAVSAGRDFGGVRAPSFLLQFNSDGTIRSEALHVVDLKTCTGVSGRVTPGSFDAPAAIAPRARTQTLNCTTGGSNSPKGATAFTVDSAGGMTLGTLSVSAEQYLQYSSYKLLDNTTFPSDNPYAQFVQVLAIGYSTPSSTINITLYVDPAGATKSVHFQNTYETGDCAP
jgi:hypothetical protein